MDDDGYPDDAELDKIAKWDCIATGDFRPLMEYVQGLWQWGDRMFIKTGEHKGGPYHGGIVVTSDVYEVSTGGWSGNESLIAAMQENFCFWAMCWVQSRRGGHFIFHVRHGYGTVEPAPAEAPSRLDSLERVVNLSKIIPE